MQLSIVIPTFNEARNIGALIRYLLAHTNANTTEVIVVNACKTSDGTAEIAIAEGAIVYECMECSRAAQLNLGAKKATYDTLYFIHADALPPTSFIQNIEDAMQKGATFGWFSYQFDSPSFWLKINARCTRRDGLFAGGGDQTLFIKKRSFQELEGFREDYRIMEDFEFVKRAKRLAIPYHIIQKDVLISARKYEQNTYLKVNTVNLIMFILFSIGCSQDRMIRFYQKVLN